MPEATATATATATAPIQRSVTASTTEAVFEAILKDIVGSVYPPGARLPSERELARMLGASRPTLREALRRLTEWRLVEPRRGSGIVVRSLSEWSIEVLPAYLRYGKPSAAQPTLPRMLLDLLALRRSTLIEIVRSIADRLEPGTTLPARAALARAWALREQPVQFQIEDFGIMRALVEAAKFFPALWLLNRLATVYLDIANSVSGLIVLPPDYIESHERLFDALETHDRDTAVTIMQEYFERHDQQLIAFLEANA